MQNQIQAYRQDQQRVFAQGPHPDIMKLLDQFEELTRTVRLQTSLNCLPPAEKADSEPQWNYFETCKKLIQYFQVPLGTASGAATLMTFLKNRMEEARATLELGLDEMIKQGTEIEGILESAGEIITKVLNSAMEKWNDVCGFFGLDWKVDTFFDMVEKANDNDDIKNKILKAFDDQWEKLFNGIHTALVVWCIAQNVFGFIEALNLLHKYRNLNNDFSAKVEQIKAEVIRCLEDIEAAISAYRNTSDMKKFKRKLGNIQRILKPYATAANATVESIESALELMIADKSKAVKNTLFSVVSAAMSACFVMAGVGLGFQALHGANMLVATANGVMSYQASIEIMEVIKERNKNKEVLQAIENAIQSVASGIDNFVKE